jgi:hypothetical protein
VRGCDGVAVAVDGSQRSPQKEGDMVLIEGLTYDEARYSPWNGGSSGQSLCVWPAWRVPRPHIICARTDDNRSDHYVLSSK